MTATTVIAPPKGSPPWLLKVIAMVPLLGSFVTYLNLGHHIKPGAVQATVVLGLLLLSVVIVTVDEVLKNGLTKAGLQKTFSEDEAWVKDNAGLLRSTFVAAKPALDQLPFVPATVDAIKHDVATLKGKVDALPAPVATDLEAVAARAKDMLLAQLAVAPKP